MKFSRLTNADELKSLIEFHNANSEFVVLDTETTSVNPREAKLIDVQLSGRNEDEVVIFGAEISSVLTNLSKVLVIVGHSYKYDAHVLFRHGIDLLEHTWRDTLLIGHLVDENRESYSLDSYVKELFNENYKEAFWKKYKSYQEAPEEDRIDYACSDIIYTTRLYIRLVADCIRESIPDSLVRHTHRLQASLLHTEIDGIRVDLNYLQDLGVRIKHRIDELRPEMWGLVEGEIRLLELRMWDKAMSKYKTDKGRAAAKRPKFSFDSTQQLQDLLYGCLELPVQKNSKTRSISTDYDSLSKIEHLHPVVKLIQEHRELQKVYTAYIEGTLDRVDASRIYPQFRVGGTVTGRIAHNNPNLAQLPKTGGIRAIYIPDNGRRFISADYSQLEVIVEANLTSDPTLIRMLEDGQSKHDVTARELGCSRDSAKTLNFAMQYWCGPGKVAKLLGVSNDEGRRVYEQYWRVYSGSKRLKEQTDKMVEDGTPIVTAFGRKRRFPPGKRTTWDKDLRQAYNFLIQGTGADITSRAFYLVDEWLRKTEYGRGCWTVHDELVVEVKEEFVEYAEKALINTMVGVGTELGLKVPLKAESSGPMLRWED